MKAFFSFTLIELLVVVAVISILASLLLPALGKARQKTFEVVCKSNERQIYSVFMSYASDYGGEYFPPRRMLPGQNETWSGALSPLVTLGYMIKNSKYLPGSSSLLFAPEICFCQVTLDYVERYDPDRLTGSYRYGDYVYNAYYSMDWADNPETRMPVFLRKIRLPSQCLLLTDGNKGDNIPSAATVFTHGRGHPYGLTNSCFFDGHAESMRKDAFPTDMTDTLYTGR